MINDFIIPLVSIILAEFGDKTQLSILSLSSKYKNFYQIIFGTMLAFILVDGIAIYFANEISNFIPIFWIKIISGLSFILIGSYEFLFNLFLKYFQRFKLNFFFNKNKYLFKFKTKFDFFNFNDLLHFDFFKSPFFISFFLILLSKFGDKSQITAGIFGTIYNPILVFIGTILGLFFLSVSAIFLGNILIKKYNKNLIENIANFIFIIIGFITIISVFI